MLLRCKNIVLTVIKNSRFILTTILLMICLFIFYDFITFKNLYSYKDIGSDTYHQFVPGFIAMSDLIKDNIPQWSFTYGLGANVYTAIPEGLFDPFNFLLYCIGRDRLIYALPYIQILQIIISGNIFFSFLKKLGRTDYTALIFAVLYSFSAQIILRGTWYHHSKDGILFALMLYAFELYFQDSKIALLPISSLLVIMMRTIYYPFLYLIIIIGYASFRYFYSKKVITKDFLIFIIKIFLLYFLGMIVGAFIFVPYMYYFINSARSSSVGLLSYSQIFSFTSIQEVLTSFLGLYSPTIMGVGSQFKGYLNYLEAPQLYCGILTIIFIPYSIKKQKGSNKTMFIFLLGFCLMYLTTNFIRYGMNLFSNMYYKTSSFWISIVLLFISSYGLDEFLKNYGINDSEDNNNILYSCIGVGLIFVVCYYLGSVYLGNIINIYILMVISTLILVYYICILNLNKINFKYGLLVVMVLEIIIFCYPVVNTRQSISKNTIDNREDYWDYTQEAISYINKIDKGFYRINKNYAVGLNDSQVYNYNGIELYKSFNNSKIMNFYKLFLPEVPRFNERVYTSTDNKNFINDFLSVKYLLVKRGHTSIPFYYSYFKKIRDIDIYKNDLFLPFGYVYDKFYRQTVVDSSYLHNRESFLFEGFIASDCFTPPLDIHEITAISPIFDNSREINLIRTDLLGSSGLEILYDHYPENINYITKNEDPMLLIKPMVIPKKNQDITLEVEISSRYTDIGQLFWKNKNSEYVEENSIKFNIIKGVKKYKLNFKCVDGIDELRLDIGQINNVNYTLKNIKVWSDSIDLYNQELIHRIDEFKKSPFSITEFNNNYIKGNIYINNTKMLFMSIPYDIGWSVSVNGKKTKLFNVNVGFSGVLLNKGYNEVIFKYQTPLLKESCYISISGLAIYIYILKNNYFNKN